MILDHIGIAVASVEAGIREWDTLFGYRQASPVVENRRQKVRVVFLAKEGSMPVKLVEPSDPKSPMFSFTRRGGGLHHLCFRCEALDAAISTLSQGGARTLVPPQPGEAFRDHKIAFLLTSGNLNIELIDTDEKALFASADRQLRG
jgi:methylmalonyl-CoA/ethylmalonyl-CoA epimerase